MRIAVLGDGAMGCLFGSLLSVRNHVVLVGVHPEKSELLRREGVRIVQADGEHLYHPDTTTDTSGMSPVDLVILFVKSMHTREALQTNAGLIGPSTLVATFQNGAGHDELISPFVPRTRIIIGTTQDNASVRDVGVVVHGGSGVTVIGLVEGESSILEPIAAEFTACGFPTKVSSEVMRSVWRKLFNNTSISALTAVLQCSMEYLGQHQETWDAVVSLVDEALSVAKADGYPFDREDVRRDIRGVLDRAHGGYTSIYSDIKAGRKTEVDMISGYVVRRAKALQVPVPRQELMVRLIHALETKPRD
jgi:2-dehydropantoate 2-reductase